MNIPTGAAKLITLVTREITFPRFSAEKITVKDITNKAGYNRGTFYEYFTDVYDVLNYIEDSLIPTLEELPPAIGIIQFY